MRLLKEKEAAEMLEISRRTLQEWRKQGKGPIFINLNDRLIRYREIDILHFIHLKSKNLDDEIRREDKEYVRDTIELLCKQCSVEKRNNPNKLNSEICDTILDRWKKSDIAIGIPKWLIYMIENQLYEMIGED